MTKLTEIINIGIEKGFDCFGLKENYHTVTFQKHNNNIQFTITTSSTMSTRHYCSLNDLIFSPDSNLMKCFFGEEDEWFTTECTCVGVDFHLYGPDIHKKECAKCGANRGKTYYQIQLLPLNDQERIEYLANALGVE